MVSQIARKFLFMGLKSQFLIRNRFFASRSRFNTGARCAAVINEPLPWNMTPGAFLYYVINRGKIQNAAIYRQILKILRLHLFRPKLFVKP